MLLIPSGEWLGSSAEEGRGKQRYAWARSMDPMNRGFPNGTSYLRMIRKDREPAELKHLSRERKRNQ